MVDDHGVTHENGPSCGRPVESHDRHVRFQFPDPVVNAGATGSSDIWLSHADANSSVMMQVPDLGAFVRALLPVHLSDGYTLTFGLWVAIKPDDLKSTFNIWWEPEYHALHLEGLLANAIPPWGLLGAPVSLAVRDPDQAPYCVASPIKELTDVLDQEWPHADILDSLPTNDVHP
jgi:hypothetical protein